MAKGRRVWVPPRLVVTLLAGLAVVRPQAVPAQAPRPGVLLLAHGSSASWNERVLAVAKEVDARQPTEVAFGMAARASIQAALNRLTARGVTEIVAVPLFVSSHSSVIRSTEYLLGLRAEAPADLALFAGMSHSGNGAATTDAHAAHVDPASPIAVTQPVRFRPAFNRHPLIGQIVADRASAMSTAPASEAVLLVAHGPVPDDDNRRWLEDMAVLAGQVRAASPFAAVDYMTVRDDAGPALREAATQELRARVTAHVSAGRRVLVVPHVMSYGGIEQGIRKRLDGLDYTMADQGLMPDPRVAAWVHANASAAQEQ
jgi:sirohydrochlorin ferrochelatase